MVAREKAGPLHSTKQTTTAAKFCGSSQQAESSAYKLADRLLLRHVQAVEPACQKVFNFGQWQNAVS